GREDGGGTGLTRSERVQPGRVSSLTGIGSPLARASRNGNTPQPAGDTAPMPRTKISLEAVFTSGLGNLWPRRRTHRVRQFRDWCDKREETSHHSPSPRP